MSADPRIEAMTVELARDPSSLVFLKLAEALRQEGDLERAFSVAERGAAWYPEMTGAWDLLARIRSDRGEGDFAFDAWTTVLRLEPEHPGAHKGLAYLAFRAGEWERSLRHLRRAVELAPDDLALKGVLDRVALEAARQAGPPAPSASPLTAPDLVDHVLLADLKGLPLGGGLTAAGGDAQLPARALADISRDAERTTRLLGLGRWRRISLGGDPGTIEIRSPTIDSLLLFAGPPALSSDQASGDADRAAEAISQWLESVR